MGKKTSGKKEHEREKNKNDEPKTLEEVTNSKNGLPTSSGDDIKLPNQHMEKNENRHDVSDNDVDFRASQSEAVREGTVVEKKEKKKKKTHEVKGGDDFELSAAGNKVVMTDDVDKDEKKRKNKRRDEVAGSDTGLSASEFEAVVESNVGKNKRKNEKNKLQEVSGNGTEFNVDNQINNDVHAFKKKKNKKEEASGHDFQLRASENKAVRDGYVDVHNTENEKDRNQKKRKLEINEDENEIQKAKKKDKRIKNEGEVSEVSEALKKKHLGVEENSCHQNDDQDDSGNNSELGASKKRKKRHKEDENNDDGQLEKVENRKKEKKKKRNKHNDDGQAEKSVILNSGVEDIVDNESSGHSSRNEVGGKGMKGHAVLEENGNKKKKAKSEKTRLKNGDKKVSTTEKGLHHCDPSENSPHIERPKKVRFSDQVQVFPSSDGSTDAKNAEGDGLVHGKRFSKEEDKMLKMAVINYIETHGLGEEGVTMVMQCRSHPELKNCWKEIGAALPWRPTESVYYRAHIIFQRDENRRWTPEELELVCKFHEKHGSNWKVLAEALGKHRFHVKDAWRRVRLPNQKKGQWSQEEYQKLFDLVNMDLRIRASGERKTKHGMLRDNISWEAISDNLATRSNAVCCMKWYDQLSSPMVAEGKWADTDDFHLVNALSSLDACNIDDVDWDNLLERRSGTICRKRWNQMVKHLGTDRNKPFPEQVEILSVRYSPDVLEAREVYNSKPAID